MDLNGHVTGRTAVINSSFQRREQMNCRRQEEPVLAPYLETAGFSLRQVTLLGSMGYIGPSTAAHLASIATADPETALCEIHDLERDGFVTLEAPPWRCAPARGQRDRPLSRSVPRARPGPAAAGILHALR